MIVTINWIPNKFLADTNLNINGSTRDLYCRHSYSYFKYSPLSMLQGVLSMVDSSRRMLLQGVYELYETEPTTEWRQDEPRINRLVFIGEYYDTQSCIAFRITTGLGACSLSFKNVLYIIVCSLHTGYNLDKKELQRNFESVIRKQ